MRTLFTTIAMGFCFNLSAFELVEECFYAEANLAGQRYCQTTCSFCIKSSPFSSRWPCTDPVIESTEIAPGEACGPFAPLDRQIFDPFGPLDEL